MADILVIEDDEQARGFIRAVLEGEGHSVREAREGGEGMRLYRKRPADLVVCDIFMEGMEGLETLHGLREEFPGVKVLMVSGGSAQFPSLDLLPVAEQIGAATLPKPFSPEALLEAVRGLLQGPAEPKEAEPKK